MTPAERVLAMNHLQHAARVISSMMVPLCESMETGSRISQDQKMGMLSCLANAQNAIKCVAMLVCEPDGQA